MKNVLAAVVMSLAVAAFPPLAGAGAPLSSSELVELQAMLQTHIEDSLVEGALLDVNDSDGGLKAYYPTKAHPKIMSAGEFLILCADMVDDAGLQVMANFYVARGSHGYVVFETTFGDDPALAALMKSGKAVMAN